MATLRQIRRRIRSVQSIQRVTRAMRMVAAARLRHAQAAVIAARPYAHELHHLIGHLSQSVSDYEHPLLSRREAQRYLVIVVTGDRGLCGAFNSNAIRMGVERLEALPEDTGLICVGNRGANHLKRRGYAIRTEYRDAFRHVSFEDARAIAREIGTAYTNAEVDHVEVVYNEFRSMLHQVPRVETLLPIPLETDEEEEDEGARSDVLYEPSAAYVLDTVLPRHLETQVWRILLESNAAEQAARMNAMENATKNADEMIDNLILERNRVRQTMITKEIAEIVGGAEALRS